MNVGLAWQPGCDASCFRTVTNAWASPFGSPELERDFDSAQIIPSKSISRWIDNHRSFDTRIMWRVGCCYPVVKLLARSRLILTNVCEPPEIRRDAHQHQARIATLGETEETYFVGIDSCLILPTAQWGNDEGYRRNDESYRRPHRDSYDDDYRPRRPHRDSYDTDSDYYRPRRPHRDDDDYYPRHGGGPYFPPTHGPVIIVHPPRYPNDDYRPHRPHETSDDSGKPNWEKNKGGGDDDTKWTPEKQNDWDKGGGYGGGQDKK